MDKNKIDGLFKDKETNHDIPSHEMKKHECFKIAAIYKTE